MQKYELREMYGSDVLRALDHLEHTIDDDARPRLLDLLVEATGVSRTVCQEAIKNYYR